jgi:hypothetical protein
MPDNLTSVNVRDFGAIGDGVTDDRDAIQRALNTGAGKTVFVPNGNYLIGQNEGFYWDLMIPAGTVLRGESRDGSILHMAPGAKQAVQLLEVLDAPDVTIMNLTLDGHADEQSEDPHRAGIFVKRSPRLSLRHLTLKNFTGDGTEIYDGSDDPFVYDILATGNRRNGLTLGGGTTGGMFAKSQFIGNYAQQFDSEGGSPIDHVTITECLFDTGGASNDFVLTMTGSAADKRSTGWTVTNNVVNGPALAVWITDVVYANNTGTNPTSKPSIYIYRSCDRILVHGNVLHTTGLGTFDAGGMIYVVGTNPGQSPGGVVIGKNTLTTEKSAYGITVICTRDATIFDNTISGSGVKKPGEAGIFVRTTRVEEPIEKIVIERNRISGFGDHGIMLGGNGAALIREVRIDWNTFSDPDGLMTSAMNLNDGCNEAVDVSMVGNKMVPESMRAMIHPPAGAPVVWGDGTRWVIPS